MTLIQDTLYAKYIKEREGSEVLEREHGFVIYKITAEECFIVDMYVDKDLRGQGVGGELIKQLTEIARARGCLAISANVHLRDKGAACTLLSSLLVGFQVVRAEANIILIVKTLGEENG